jgi:uncharacterized membrane protein
MGARFRVMATCVVVIASGCGSPDVRQEDDGAAMRDDAVTAVYECPGGGGFVARIQGDTAWLFLPGNTVAATHVPAASGAKYTDGEATYWSHGDEASIEAPGFEAGECRNNRRAAIWEHAKLNGVDFRAVGNEPGWHLEIRRGRSIVFVTDYGQARYEFPAPELDEDRDRARAVYRTGDGDHELVVQLEGRRCLDTMADDEYETTVTVTLDGHEVRGCGRPLH